MNTNSKPAAEVLVSEKGAVNTDSPRPRSTDPAPASAKEKTAAAKPTAAPSLKPRTATRRPSLSSRTASKAQKLVCRYCGSDDLAPSFKKRRDARCRACFKKRYSSAMRGKQATRGRKAKPKILNA